MNDAEKLSKIFAATEHLESVRKSLLDKPPNGPASQEFERALQTCVNKLNDIHALTGIKTPYQDGLTGPHYRHDDAIVTNTGIHDEPVHCCDKPFTFLRIRNTGMLTWHNRHIKCLKSKEVLLGQKHPIIVTDRQTIPNLKPNETAAIPIVIDAGAKTGNFELVCEIHDENDQNCFPNKPDLIRIQITVENI